MCVKMKNNPLISIITPTYNQEEFISDCIDSVLAQDYSNWELIIIDDGSTDSTEQIISKYQDKRIIYIKQENEGIWNLNKNYNKALQKAKGEIIAILEGDDFWPPYKLSKQISAFKDPDVILSWGDAGITNRKGHIIERQHRNIFKSNESIPGDSILKQLVLRNFIPACTVLCRKRALIKIGGFKQPENSPCVDIATWLHLSEEGKFYYFNDILGYWRRHGTQTTANKKLEIISANNNYLANYFSNLPQQKKELIGISVENINQNTNQKLANVHFHMGRVALYKKDWKKGRKKFKITLKMGNFSLKTKSIIGIIFSYFHVNFEGIAKRLQYTQLDDLN